MSSDEICKALLCQMVGLIDCIANCTDIGERFTSCLLSLASIELFDMMSPLQLSYFAYLHFPVTLN